MPCLPSGSKTPPKGKEWVHEIKFDGYRLLARREGNRIRLISGTGSTGFVWVLDPYESLLDLPCGPEDVIANRILSVLVYLRRIQEK